MTRLSATLFFSAACLAVFAEACCNQLSYGLYCADGTKGTPWCGYGKCNVFGCNCNGGCRKENYEGCVNKACWDQAIGQVQQVCTDGTFDCINKYGWPSKSSATKRSSEFRREDVPAAVNGSCSMSSADLFKTVDKDGSGNLTLAEYMHYVGYTQGAPTDPEHIALHVEHFVRFDKNGDGVVHFDEHHRTD